MEIILTHENADFDAVAGLLATSKLYPDAKPVIPDRLNKNIARFIELYQAELPFVTQKDVRSRTVSKIIVVDTQRAAHIKGIASSTPVHIIDHHLLSHKLPAHYTFESETVGAVTTLLVERLRDRNIHLTTLEATLLALGIYEDTGSLSYGATTGRDLQAAGWCIEQGAELDLVRDFLSSPLNQEQRDLLDQLTAHAESRVIEGYTVIISGVLVASYVSEISSVVHRLRDLLDPAALFVLVEMPNGLQLVARSTEDAVDVGDVARLLGGGGHGRAAAANIHDRILTECIAFLWEELSRRIKPVTHVSDLMSLGVQTVEVDKLLRNVVRQLRKIGHEGFPVLENGQVVGLLTRRDLDRALEHDLKDLTVRDIMLKGGITASPDETVYALLQRVVKSGWGQIPVVDENDRLIGIVTRTDLLEYWARGEPLASASEKFVTQEQLSAVLGAAPASLIQQVAEYAQQIDSKVYLVGGVVRDLLLYRSNWDIDFVIEGDAIAFARQLEEKFGGNVSSFQPFGTAKWELATEGNGGVQDELTSLPQTVDFASARNEFYEHPTALPTVYNSSIRLDLQRRDFTMNTLAIQLSPAANFGHILDFYGGLGDLQSGIIRVLHSLSFIDDPTRILRAVRFRQRLGFTIEARTAELISGASPMLGRITGERLRNELTLLLCEAQPEKGLLELKTRGVLQAIHPGFQLAEDFQKGFQGARKTKRPWDIQPTDSTDLSWYLLAMYLPVERCESVLERLLLGRTLMQAILHARQILEREVELSKAKMLPSEAVEILEGITELGLMAAWIVSKNRKMRMMIQRYWTEWRHIQPSTNGHTLRNMGITPGPCYGMILKRLRSARLNGEVANAEAEQNLLHKLIEDEKVCDD